MNTNGIDFTAINFPILPDHCPYCWELEPHIWTGILMNVAGISSMCSMDGVAGMVKNKTLPRFFFTAIN